MRRATLLLLTLALAGCGFLSRSKSTFYSLERIAPATPVAARTGTPIGIDVVELPPGFDRRDIVVRKPDLQLEIREKQQWSASLEEMVLHTLAFDLAARLPEGMVILPGQVRPITPTRGIDLVVENFAAGPDNTVVLDARWILREGTRETSHHEQISVPVPSLESKNVAHGFSEALATLADRIAAAI
ncbi:MAG TPA: PqiC family protein [Thermoanaerobaculia bacterium]|nr:PqiC family protein [Thermoanaerobaculia bacterium]